MAASRGSTYTSAGKQTCLFGRTKTLFLSRGGCRYNKFCVSSTKIMLSLSFHLVKAIRKGWCGVGELVLATAMATVIIFLQLLIVAVSHSPVQFECSKCAF